MSYCWHQDLSDVFMSPCYTIYFKGVNYFVKKAALYIRPPEILIKYNGNEKWMFSIRSTFINKDIEFIPGEEFEESNTRKLEKNILKN